MEAPVVAVVGGGQLARMMAAPAAALGIELRVLVESGQSAAAQVVRDAPVGRADDAAALASLVSSPSLASVLTFEHEHVPNGLLRRIDDDGVPVRPGPHALVHAQDKIVMRARLAELGIPVPRWAAVPDATALEAFLAGVGGRAVVKTARGGYDGKGVRVVHSAEDVADWFEAYHAGEGPELLAEEVVAFGRELAVLAARSPSGEVRTWPVVESVQVDGVCAEVIAPAPALHPETEAAARDVAVRVAEGLDVVGVLAVELFEVRGGAGLFDVAPGAALVAADGARPPVLVNELAMRPHNSGHWTIDGAVTSQFEQHLRAVLDLPLGDTSARAPWSVMVNVLGSTHGALTDALPLVAAADDGAKVHLYGKEVRPGRKLGHVTVTGTDLAEVRHRARGAAALLRGEAGGGTDPGGGEDG